MNSLLRFLHRGGSRGLLLGLVGVLLAVRLGFSLQEAYRADQAELESRQATLARTKKLTEKIPELRGQLQGLNGERDRLQKFLFSGASEDTILSAMQLDLQALVATAGLEVETVRPLKQKSAQANGGEATLGEVVIKVSVNGTLAGYQTLLAELYRSPKVYKVEAVTISPYKKSELKILIDLRGYFVIAAPEVAASTGSGGTAPGKESGNGAMAPGKESGSGAMAPGKNTGSGTTPSARIPAPE